MLPLKITRIGNTLGVMLPDTLVERLRMKAGDTLYLEIAPSGAAVLTYDASSLSVDPMLVEQLRAGHEFMRDFQVTLRALAT